MLIKQRLRCYDDLMNISIDMETGQAGKARQQVGSAMSYVHTWKVSIYEATDDETTMNNHNFPDE